MKNYRKEVLRDIREYRQVGGGITKFQSPAGPIEAQQRYAAATDRPIETYKLNDKSLDELYDLTHNTKSGLVYQVVNGILYLLAPTTLGMTAIPASLMSAASIGSDVHNIQKNGANLDNVPNLILDSTTPIAGVKYIKTAVDANRKLSILKRLFDNAVSNPKYGNPYRYPEIYLNVENIGNEMSKVRSDEFLDRTLIPTYMFSRPYVLRRPFTNITDKDDENK